MSVKKIRCLVPFQVMQFGTWGFVRSCCPSWTKVGPIGNLAVDNDIMAIWNSPRIQKIRKAVLEGRLESVCHMNFCPHAVTNRVIDLDDAIGAAGDENLRKNLEQVKAGKTELETGPLYINLSDTGDCNLKCKMCRSNDAFYKNDKSLNRRLFDDVLPTILPTASYMTLTGNGDPFFRRDTREFMQSKTIAEKYPHLQLQIITNAQLFTDGMWEKVKHNRFSSISVSVDAATASTYEYVRKGGSWERLTENLKRISALRRQNVFSEFHLSFLVLRSNCGEIRDFARLALDLKCDSVIFQKVSGLLDVRENFNFTKDIEALALTGEQLADPVFKEPNVNMVEIAPCRMFAGRRPAIIDRMRTRLIILLWTPPMRLYYDIRYRFAPLYFSAYKFLRRFSDRLFRKK